MAKKRKKKHDELLEEIVGRLKAWGYRVYPNKTYWLYYSGGKKYEADILAVNPERRIAYAVEIKTTHHKRAKEKALEQLMHDYVFLRKLYGDFRIRLFYVTNDGVKYINLEEIGCIKEENFLDWKDYFLA